MAGPLNPGDNIETKGPGGKVDLSGVEATPQVGSVAETVEEKVETESDDGEEGEGT